MSFFNLFQSKTPQDPLDDEMRNYLEYNLLWLGSQFDPDLKKTIETLSIQKADFPFEWKDDNETLEAAICFVAEKMDLSRDSIEIELYENPVKLLDSGNEPVYLEQDENDPTSAGLFFGKNEKGKFEVAIEKSNMNNPEILLATLAHEFAHIKLLGEKRIEENDEMLTDLTTVYFGFGIFGANHSFHFYNSTEGWGHRRMGYLTDMEWAYSLAFNCFLQGESAPEWQSFLTPSLQKSFSKCAQYIEFNTEAIKTKYGLV